jgi:serine/arginine repetitive matrix protein 2
VIAIIEDAVKSVGLETSSSEPTIQTLPPPSPFAKPPLRRPPSLKGMPFYPPAEPARPIHPRPPSTNSTTTPAVSTPILAVQAESWRSKANPLPPQTSRQVHARPPVPSFMPPPPSALEQVESLAKDPEEELEVVDFSDLAKFVGVPDKDQHVEAIPSSSSLARLSRPIASDFFDDRPAALEVVTPVKNDVVAWRRKSSLDFGMAHPSTFEQQNDTTMTSAKDRPRTDAVVENSFASDAASTTSTKETTPSVDHHHTIPTVNVPPYSGTQRTPRVQTFYKEAAMSALDDTLSRIKGALDGMQAGEAPKDPQHSGSAESETFTTSSARSLLPHSHPSVKSSPPKERWVPPALRVRHFDFEPQEVFHVTGCEPPRSPKPAWNAFIVRLPKLSHSLEPPNEKRLRLSIKPPYAVRWDILSFDPPVEGMNRRDLSLNDILFRKQAPFKGRHKYRVLLPRHRGPRVNIPVHTVAPKINGVGTFGRAAGLDGLSTWRKVTSPPSTTIEIRDTMTSEFGLDTMSRSPPPELSSDLSVASMPKSDASIPTKSDGPLVPIRSRSQPKMPAGSAVAFYRDSRIDAVESDPKPLVNFIVTSELEESRQSQSTATPSKPQPSITISSPSSNLLPPPDSSASVGENTSKPLPPMVNGLGSSSASTEHTITSLMQSQAENKSSDNMVCIVRIINSILLTTNLIG